LPLPPCPLLFPYTTLFRSTDPRRGGVVTMGAVLAATSDPDRTSLVKRGKWVLETIMATPPPPPIPDAANLKDDPEALKLPLRQRSEEHTSELQSRVDLVCR